MSYSFSLPLQVRWSDCDALGHVNNAVFVTYFELGRGPYMMKVSPQWNWQKHMFLIGRISVDFKRELTLYAKNPRVALRTSRLGGKSFDIEYAILSDGKEGPIVHATGVSTQVMFDMKERKTIAIYPWLRNDLLAFEADLHTEDA